MLSDLINPNKNNAYNIKIAQAWGLELSIYLSTIMTLCGSRDELELDSVNKQIIMDLTTLNEKKQDQLLKKLTQLGVVDLLNKSIIKVNFDNLISLFNSDDKEIKKDVKSIVKRRRTKSEAIKDELRNYIESADPKLRDAYSTWIDSVTEKQGWMSKASITEGQNLLNKTFGNNVDLIIEVLNIASINGYRDITWAINKKLEDDKNKKSFNFNTSAPNKPIELANDIF